MGGGGVVQIRKGGGEFQKIQKLISGGWDYYLELESKLSYLFKYLKFPRVSSIVYQSLHLVQLKKQIG